MPNPFNHIYFVSSPHTSLIKIGFSSDHPQRTRSRYTTYYGSDHELQYWKAESKDETETHKALSKYRLPGTQRELYKAEFSQECLSYLTEKFGVSSKQEIAALWGGELVPTEEEQKKMDEEVKAAVLSLSF